MTRLTGELHNQVAIVTGAGSSFGAGIARRFAQEGAKLVVNDINAEGGTRVAKETGGEFVQADVTRAGDWAKYSSRRRRRSSVAWIAWSTTPAGRTATSPTSK